MSEDIAACAAIVERGDPVRFRAVMAAPLAARERLFPLYAFNVEVARAPWVGSEPGIAEMRLQWWIDALEEIAQGGVVRRHEVVVPLALVISARQARRLQKLVEARFLDLETAPFRDTGALKDYLTDTSSVLMRIAAEMLGQTDETVSENAGFALGVANWFGAVSALQARGKLPMPDNGENGVIDLAEQALTALGEARAGRIVRAARPAFLVMAGVAPTLRRAIRAPSHVLEGQIADGEWQSRRALLKTVLTGRW